MARQGHREFHSGARTGRDWVLTLAAVALLFILLGSSIPKLVQPSTAQTGYSITESWIDQQLVAWQPSSVYPMDFGVPDLRISYGNVYDTYNTQAVVNASLGVLEQTGANMVRIDMGFDAFLANDSSTISAFDTYTHWINDSGKRLVLADASAERYRSYPLNWNDFKNQWLIRAYVLAHRYHPYAYIVVKEPGWYYPMISDVARNPQVFNASDWTVLTKDLIEAVHLGSPQTKVGVAVAAIDLYHDPTAQGRTSFNVQYLEDVEKLQNLSFIGFDISDIPGFQDTQQFLSQAGSNGKQVWIAEAWSADGTVVTDPTRSTLDSNWIRALYYFGLMEHAQVIEPFYTDLFAAYGTPPTDQAGLLQFYQGRTPVFSEFQQIISTNGAGQLPTGTATVTSSQASSSSATSSQQSSSSGSSTAQSTGQQGGSKPASTATQDAEGIVFLLLVAAVVLVLVRRRRRGP